MVLDALLTGSYNPDCVAFYDENENKVGTMIEGYRIERLAEDLGPRVGSFHVCVGNNAIRQRVHQRCVGIGGRAVSVVHRSAIVSNHCLIGDGTFLAGGSIVGPSAVLGLGVIVNHGAIIDHECTVGDFCHVAPGVTLAGNVKLGDRVLVGAGANLLPGIRVGDDVIIGAGAVVTADVAGNTTVVGVPARSIR